VSYTTDIVIPTRSSSILPISEIRMDALLRVCSISGEILGTPSAELGKALEGADVQVYRPYQSM